MTTYLTFKNPIDPLALLCSDGTQLSGWSILHINTSANTNTIRITGVKTVWLATPIGYYLYNLIIKHFLGGGFGQRHLLNWEKKIKVLGD